MGLALRKLVAGPREVAPSTAATPPSPSACAITLNTCGETSWVKIFRPNFHPSEVFRFSYAMHLFLFPLVCSLYFGTSSHSKGPPRIPFAINERSWAREFRGGGIFAQFRCPNYATPSALTVNNPPILTVQHLPVTLSNSLHPNYPISTTPNYPTSSTPRHPFSSCPAASIPI